MFPIQISTEQKLKLQVQKPTPFIQHTIFRKEQPMGRTSHSREWAVSFKNVNLSESLIYNQSDYPRRC